MGDMIVVKEGLFSTIIGTHQNLREFSVGENSRVTGSSQMVSAGGPVATPEHGSGTNQETFATGAELSELSVTVDFGVVLSAASTLF